MRTKLLRLCTILSLIIGSLFIAVPSVFAGVQGSCIGDSEFVLFYENRIGDTSDGDDRLYQCNSSESNYADGPAHTLAGKCKGAFSPDDEWNDCISGAFVHMPSDRVLCVYGSSSWTGGSQRFTAHDTRQNMSSFMDDGMTSYRFRSESLAC